ncbi:hypothetical protein IWQ60_001090 [Tieghemiomyces parasiticus]|uniref:Protein farnesyltransferase/geranylgeranyltransferase type-1 subunit alpha n=1 Tax=Tieghemiomyces parasiticus TaxID=78921 RepID=A0A9W8AEN7_9FUNG|nr:hypothetical protein IWQ60_001090 [Tieghemiomyces parasiticus]
MVKLEDSYVPLSQLPEWSDVTPIPQDDGPHPVAPIAYTQEYAEAMDYLRAVMKARELSSRALELTEEIVWLNAGHYTAWAYRLDILKHLNVDLYSELDFLSEFAEVNPKTYQLWHHRQEIVKLLNDPSREHDFIAKLLATDSKNFHAWSYRQWVVTQFNQWDGELPYVAQLIDEDVRNNSAWNQRYFVLTRGSTQDLDRDTLRREIDYCLEKMALAPNNECPFAYCRGLLKKFGTHDDWLLIRAQLRALGGVANAGDVAAARSQYAWGLLLDTEEHLIREATEEEGLTARRAEVRRVRTNFRV